MLNWRYAVLVTLEGNTPSKAELLGHVPGADFLCQQARRRDPIGHGNADNVNKKPPPLAVPDPPPKKVADYVYLKRARAKFK